MSNEPNHNYKSSDTVLLFKAKVFPDVPRKKFCGSLTKFRSE